MIWSIYCILSDRGLSMSYVFLPGDVDPWHRQGEGTRASAGRGWEAVSGRDKAEGNNKPDPPLQQGQPQRHTVRATTAGQQGSHSEEIILSLKGDKRKRCLLLWALKNNVNLKVTEADVHPIQNFIHLVSNRGIKVEQSGWNDDWLDHHQPSFCQKISTELNAVFIRNHLKCRWCRYCKAI